MVVVFFFFAVLIICWAWMVGVIWARRVLPLLPLLFLSHSLSLLCLFLWRAALFLAGAGAAFAHWGW